MTTEDPRSETPDVTRRETAKCLERIGHMKEEIELTVAHSREMVAHSREILRRVQERGASSRS